MTVCMSERLPGAMPGAVFVERKENSIQHVVADCASQPSELCHEQLVEGRLQHELERDETFAPVPYNQERCRLEFTSTRQPLSGPTQSKPRCKCGRAVKSNHIIFS
jgi:hypothetical protein